MFSEGENLVAPGTALPRGWARLEQWHQTMMQTSVTSPRRSRKLDGATLGAGLAKVVLNLGLRGEWHSRITST